MKRLTKNNITSCNIIIYNNRLIWVKYDYDSVFGVIVSNNGKTIPWNKIPVAVKQFINCHEIKHYAIENGHGYKKYRYCYE